MACRSTARGSLLFLLILPLVACLTVPSLNPTAVIKNGTVVGSSNGGIDSFLGIPYLQPPTGDNRLRLPKAITKTFGTYSATATPSFCPQYAPSTPSSSGSIAPTDVPGLPTIVGLALNPIPPSQQSEDCLYLSVQRPTGTTASSKLPVIAWIHGGAFLTGGSGLYNAQQILLKSITLSQPFVFVAMNYRLGAFGFLAGSQLSKEGNTNIGLHDQRSALHWIAENIAAFGGDPDKVTLWGESAGSWSVTDHTLINGGDNKYKGKALFRSVVQNSGAIYPAVDVRHPKPQGAFDLLAKNAGCSSSKDIPSCLRKLPYQSYLDAQQKVVLGGGSINFPFIARPDASSSFFKDSGESAVAAGRYTKVPTLAYNQQDEGTLFGLVNMGSYTTDEDYLKFFAPIFPTASNKTLISWFSLYPTDPASGSPYDTGALNEIYPGYKRLSAMCGDIMFILMRRIYLDTLSCSSSTVWSGFQTFDHDAAVVGTTHSTDVFATYFGVGTPTAVDELQTRLISFVSYQDPNRLKKTAGTTLAWPKYSSGTRQLLSVNPTDTTLITDDFRYLSYQFIKSHIAEFKI